MESSLFSLAEQVSLVIGFLGIGAIIFSIYRHFKEPQNTSITNDALIVQQMKMLSESTDRRFNEIQENFKQLLLQSNNHIHTVDGKVDKLAESVRSMGEGVVRLGTIIEERVPKRN